MIWLISVSGFAITKSIKKFEKYISLSDLLIYPLNFVTFCKQCTCVRFSNKTEHCKATPTMGPRHYHARRDLAGERGRGYPVQVIIPPPHWTGRPYLDYFPLRPFLSGRVLEARRYPVQVNVHPPPRQHRVTSTRGRGAGGYGHLDWVLPPPLG